MDGQRPAQQRLGLPQTVRGLQQHRPVVELYGDVRAFGAVRLLDDGQCTAQQRLGCLVFASLIMEDAQSPRAAGRRLIAQRSFSQRATARR